MKKAREELRRIFGLFRLVQVRVRVATANRVYSVASHASCDAGLGFFRSRSFDFCANARAASVGLASESDQCGRRASGGEVLLLCLGFLYRSPRSSKNRTQPGCGRCARETIPKKTKPTSSTRKIRDLVDFYLRVCNSSSPVLMSFPACSPSN